MKNRKKVTLLVLGILIIAGLSSAIVSKKSYHILSYKSEIPKEQVSQTLTSETGSQTVLFETSDEFPYYRIYVENNSKVNYILVAPDGEYTVTPGSAQTVYSTGFSKPTTFNVSVTASNGEKLDGKIVIRVASTLAEVKTQ